MGRKKKNKKQKQSSETGLGLRNQSVLVNENDPQPSTSSGFHGHQLKNYKSEETKVKKKGINAMPLTGRSSYANKFQLNFEIR